MAAACCWCLRAVAVSWGHCGRVGVAVVVVARSSGGGAGRRLLEARTGAPRSNARAARACGGDGTARHPVLLASRMLCARLEAKRAAFLRSVFACRWLQKRTARRGEYRRLRRWDARRVCCVRLMELPPKTRRVNKIKYPEFTSICLSSLLQAVELVSIAALVAGRCSERAPQARAPCGRRACCSILHTVKPTLRQPCLHKTGRHPTPELESAQHAARSPKQWPAKQRRPKNS